MRTDNPSTLVLWNSVLTVVLVGPVTTESIAFAQHPERSFFSNGIELAMRADQNLRVLLL